MGDLACKRLVLENNIFCAKASSSRKAEKEWY